MQVDHYMSTTRRRVILRVSDKQSFVVDEFIIRNTDEDGFLWPGLAYLATQESLNEMQHGCEILLHNGYTLDYMHRTQARAWIIEALLL